MSTTSALGGIVRRREDPALIEGKGRYVDDIKLHNEAALAFVRSPLAHAKVLSIDTSAALAMDGVFAVYTAADVEHMGALVAQVAIVPPPLLNGDVVKHVGEAVAMVVASDRYVAQDAIDAIFVDYEPMDPIVDLTDAASDRIVIHEGTESNTVISWVAPFGAEPDAQAAVKTGIEEAMAREDTVVVSQEMTNQRLIPTAIEPRRVLADWEDGYKTLTVHTSSQIPHAVAGGIAVMLGLPSTSVRVIAPEVGGGFGSKLNVYREEILVAWASQQLGRPIRWTETRREAATATTQGRGWIGTATLVGTRDGELLGYMFEGLADMGAYTQGLGAAIPFLGLFVASGQYKMPTYWKVDCVVTNTATVDAYRGAGRPEAMYYIERIVDMFAKEIDMDPAELRLKNFIPASEFPVAMSPAGFAMDTGDYAMNLNALLETGAYDEMKATREAARAEGRHVGIGLSTYVEVCGFAPAGLADLGFSWSAYGLPSAYNGSGLVRVNPDATVTVMIGTGPSGQGHQTTWAQIVSDRLGIAVEDIVVHHGDTGVSAMGIGSFGSRSAAVDGSATYEAADRVRAKAAKIAAHLLEANEEDIVFADGAAHVAGSPDSSVAWSEIATASYQAHKAPEGLDGGLESEVLFSPANATWPFGAHLALVEVDVETGNVEILRYVAMDDCGNVINPMIVDGQIHGGIAQGIGQALLEEAVYDEHGNLLTGSMVDYPIPTAGDVPMFELHRTVTPTDINAMGVKGVGEAGTIGSAQTIVNAVVDAVAPLGVTHIDMPLRPKRVWEAINAASGNGRA